ncbi:MAG TPA: methionine biosynthesis protein MetW [Alphaproteobacteria bacterium]|nr:methionine biosynthesis protein MetW [Alphaproteobacteria bacterium]
MSQNAFELRKDFKILEQFVPQASKIIDLGCGRGELLAHLAETRKTHGLGIDLRSDHVSACLTKGLSAIQGDGEVELVHYPANSFDLVILSQTLQALAKPHDTIDEMLRVANKALVSFPNFAYWKFRSQLLFKGCMPVTKALPHQWYDTPNIHFCTIRDFVNFCGVKNITIEQSKYITSSGHIGDVAGHVWRANMFGAQAVFLISRQ